MDAQSIQDIQDILERLTNLLRIEIRTFGLKHGLQPVQIEALAYLTQCNRYSDTPQAVTEFLGLTKGTVSQSLKILEEKDLLKKQHDTEDKRIIHLIPTARGKKLIHLSITEKGLAKALKEIKPRHFHELEENLRSILRGLQQQNNQKTFATCHTCRFNEHHPEGYLCGLTQETLTKKDIQLICREHEYPSA